MTRDSLRLFSSLVLTRTFCVFGTTAISVATTTATSAAFHLSLPGGARRSFLPSNNNRHSTTSGTIVASRGQPRVVVVTSTTTRLYHSSRTNDNKTEKNSSERRRSMSEKILDNPQYPIEWPYSESDFLRQDESDDGLFYEPTRLVYHIDDEAVSALTNYYSKILKDGDDILDLCSSWVSHYPSNFQGGNVIGLGMNEYELKQNKQLSSYVVRDLNIDSTLPFDDESFDKVTCVVSIDYLTKPREIFQEIGRVLRPGGICYMTLSNRCFPTKAFRLWLLTNDIEHVFIVGSFFHYSGLFESSSCDDISPNPGRTDPLFVVKAEKKK